MRPAANLIALVLTFLGSMHSLHAGEITKEASRLKQPNVIVILSDDQGWADIGYNNAAVYSPNLDRMASAGVVFTQHYVMPQCTPTRVALMTGRYPGRFGKAGLAANNQPAFPLGTPTLATMFKSAGYETFLCGKWHLGSMPKHGPNHFGFDHSYGSLAGAVGMYDHRYRKGKFENSWHRNLKPLPNHENGTHATDLLAQEAIKIIKTKREKPFFLYVPFQSVHTPLDERGPFVDQPTQIDPDHPGRWRNEDKIRWFNDPKGLIQKEKDPEKRLFLAAVYHLDHAIGQIVKAVETSGQKENTLILFSSDNGPQVNWPGKAYPDDLKLTNFNQPHPFRGHKTHVWEGGIHVPGFAYWPGTISSRKIDSPVHIVDWFPTLAKLLDYRPDSKIDWDGVDLDSLLFAGGKLPERDLYWIWSQRTNRWALRSGDWKIVKYGVGEPKLEEWKLFDLKNDPAEKTNLSTKHKDRLQQLHEKFLQQRSKDKK